MQLATYLRRNRISIRDFADQIGLSPEGVRLLVTGQRRPRLSTLDRIAAATGDKVREPDFMLQTRRHRPPRVEPAANQIAAEMMEIDI